MKKFLIVAFVVLCGFLWFSGVEAKPFLRCNPQEGVQGYEVKGIPNVPELLAARVDGSLEYDLANLPIGTYDVTVKACNVWDCGEAEVMPPFTKTVPTKPVNLRISVE